MLGCLVDISPCHVLHRAGTASIVGVVGVKDSWMRDSTLMHHTNNNTTRARTHNKWKELSHLLLTEQSSIPVSLQRLREKLS
jgi:hypothetical protein